MIPAAHITGLVLAGGHGQRMGGSDKGLLPLAGRPLAWHALERLRPQVGTLAISANRHLGEYEALGVPVWPDAQAFEGPLGGLLAGLSSCNTAWLLTVPCDAPFFPADLALRLAKALDSDAEDRRLAIAWGRDAGGAALAPQPVFCLLHQSLRDDLARYLATGGRRVGEWVRRAGAARVDFDRPALDEWAFLNLNQPSDWQALEVTEALQPRP